MPNKKNSIVKIKESGAFDRKIINSSGFHIVRFCAAWSGPCQIMGPVYEEMHEMFKTVASFYRIDIDEAPLLKEKFAVNDLPTIFFYRNGVVIDCVVGLISRESFISKLESAVK